jgi:hypothetical protein
MDSPVSAERSGARGDDDDEGDESSGARGARGNGQEAGNYFDMKPEGEEGGMERCAMDEDDGDEDK